MYFQPIRFAIFDKESVNRGLPLLEPLEVSILGADQKDHSLWGREWGRDKPSGHAQDQNVRHHFFCRTAVAAATQQGKARTLLTLLV